MTTETTTALGTGLAATIFAAAFLFGDKIHPLQSVIRDRRSIASFGAGLSAAYVFVHLMPEVSAAREAFSVAMSEAVRYEGMVIYFIALVGFLAFYGLEHFRRRSGREAGRDAAGTGFKLHIGGWAAYVGVAAYLLVHNLEETTVSMVAYALAITFHLLAADHEFRREHGAAYSGTGRFVLAGAALVGWLLALLVEVPLAVTAAGLSFVSGAVIINSAIMELPAEKQGRFPAFASGSVLYGLVLLPLG